MKKNLIFLVAILLMMGCATEPKTNWKEMSLLEHGVPLTILAPDSTKVQTMDFGLQKDITIQKGDDFSLQIYASDATTMDVKKVKAQQLAMLEDARYFDKVVQDDENGFIYENKIDSTTSNYGFRHIKIQGDKEYIFRTGLIGAFTEVQVRKMYDAVKNGK